MSLRISNGDVVSMGEVALKNVGLGFLCWISLEVVGVSFSGSLGCAWGFGHVFEPILWGYLWKQMRFLGLVLGGRF